MHPVWFAFHSTLIRQVYRIFNTIASSFVQVSKHSRQRMHSGSVRLLGTSLMPMEHSMSQRPQWLQESKSACKRIGESLLKIANVAPSGQRYLHQTRSTSKEVMEKMISTLQSKPLVNLKLKTARTGQNWYKGG